MSKTCNDRRSPFLIAGGMGALSALQGGSGQRPGGGSRGPSARSSEHPAV